MNDMTGWQFRNSDEKETTQGPDPSPEPTTRLFYFFSSPYQVPVHAGSIRFDSASPLPAASPKQPCYSQESGQLLSRPDGQRLQPDAFCHPIFPLVMTRQDYLFCTTC